MYTNGSIYGVDSNARIPAFPNASPVCTSWCAFGKQDNNAPEVSEEKSSHDGPCWVFDISGILETKEEEQDRDFEKAYAGEEEDLSEPSKLIVVHIVSRVDVPSVSSIANPDLCCLDAESSDAEKRGNDYSEVIPAQGS